MLRAGCTLLQLANTGRAAARPEGGWRGGGEEGYDEGGCQGGGVRPGVRGVDVSDRYSAKSAGRAETARLCVSTVGPSRDPDVATTRNLRGGIFESMPADIRLRTRTRWGEGGISHAPAALYRNGPRTERLLA